jgi:phosphatidylinositol alpha-1,6-mannosyltransferase
VGDQRDREYFGRLQKLAADLGVIDAVVFKQHLDEQQLRDEYSFAGLFVLPSVNVGDHFEGFGLVFLEAAATGLPVIGTTGNGIADAVSPDNGILVPQRDVQSLANAVVSVLGDDARWRSMSAASIAWAQRHPVDDMIDRYEEVYRSSKMP